MRGQERGKKNSLFTIPDRYFAQTKQNFIEGENKIATFLQNKNRERERERSFLHLNYTSIPYISHYEQTNSLFLVHFQIRTVEQRK